MCKCLPCVEPDPSVRKKALDAAAAKAAARAAKGKAAREKAAAAAAAAATAGSGDTPSVAVTVASAAPALPGVVARKSVTASKAGLGGVGAAPSLPGGSRAPKAATKLGGTA
ncbi:unnamed protein product, partial [Laminaria digitata]